MKSRSISRRLITGMLLLELLSALALIGVTAVYERHIHFRAFDVMLRGRADSLFGAVGDAEDKADSVLLDTSVIAMPKQSIFDVEEDGTDHVLGHSEYWPAKQVQENVSSADQNGIFRVRLGGVAYRFVRVHGVRVVDPGDVGGGVKHSVTVLYGEPVERVWEAVWHALRFFALATVLLLAATGGLMAWFLQQGLSPLHELAGEAGRISAQQWQFTPPERARVTRELAPLTAAIEAALGRLQQSFEQQRRFTSDAAHELKTDVAIVKSSLQLLAMKPRSSEMYSSGLEVCLEDCVRLENTVLQMLTLARAEYAPASASVVREMCALGPCVEESVRQFASLAELREVRVTLSAPEHTGVLLGAKECGILCSNLLHNALQHSPVGSTIAIRLANAQGWVTMSVEDHGEGIAPESLPHVFEPFYRGDASRDRKSGGTGLGLTICRALCEEAGGSISIASEVGAGTVVTVQLLAWGMVV